MCYWRLIGGVKSVPKEKFNDVKKGVKKSQSQPGSLYVLVIRQLFVESYLYKLGLFVVARISLEFGTKAGKVLSPPRS